MDQELCEDCGDVFDEEDLDANDRCVDCAAWAEDVETAEDET